MKSASRSESELSVLIFPLLLRDDGVEDIPVFRDLAVLHTKEVIEGSVLPAQRTFADRKYEAALSEDLVDAVEFERDSLLGPGAHCSAQSRDLVRDMRVVLNVVVAIEVAREQLHPAIDEDVVHKPAHEGFVRLSAVEIRRRRWPVNHRVAAWIRAGGLLEIVPVLDNQTVFKSKDVESSIWAEEVVRAMCDDDVASPKHSYTVDSRGVPRQFFQQLGHACGAIGDGDIVLDVPRGIDYTHRFLIAGFDRL